MARLVGDLVQFTGFLVLHVVDGFSDWFKCATGVFG